MLIKSFVFALGLILVAQPVFAEVTPASSEAHLAQTATALVQCLKAHHNSTTACAKQYNAYQADQKLHHSVVVKQQQADAKSKAVYDASLTEGLNSDELRYLHSLKQSSPQMYDTYLRRGKPCHISTSDTSVGHLELWSYDCVEGGTVGKEQYTFINGKLTDHIQL